MKTLKYLIVILLVLTFSTVQAEENIRRIATWNMKWLGTNSGNQLDPVENVPAYADYIHQTEATLFALQEIGATHSVDGNAKCYYLDLIVEELNSQTENENWTYILDEVNKNQRLAFLYKRDEWQVSNPQNIRPGKSYNHIRRPFMVSVTAVGENAQLHFDYINIHLKAFPDEKSQQRREDNIQELAYWLINNITDEDVLISGDTNIYMGETDVDDAMEDIGYKYLYDAERTSIHEDKLSQRFDRFFVSSGLLNEVNSAKDIIGSKLYVDVIKENDEEKVIWFDQNISDHYPVILNIDVSQER